MSVHVHLIVRDTGARGRGVFAQAPIPAGTLIETADIILIPETELQAIERGVFGDYFFRWGADGRQGALALGYGSIYNHSFTPNARYVKHFDRGTVDFIAIRDIAAGEEIRTNYNGDPDSQEALWFPTSE